MVARGPAVPQPGVEQQPDGLQSAGGQDHPAGGDRPGGAVPVGHPDAGDAASVGGRLEPERGRPGQEGDAVAHQATVQIAGEGVRGPELEHRGDHGVVQAQRGRGRVGPVLGVVAVGAQTADPVRAFAPVVEFGPVDRPPGGADLGPGQQVQRLHRQVPAADRRPGRLDIAGGVEFETPLARRAADPGRVGGVDIGVGIGILDRGPDVRKRVARGAADLQDADPQTRPGQLGRHGQPGRAGTDNADVPVGRLAGIHCRGPPAVAT